MSEKKQRDRGSSNSSSFNNNRNRNKNNNRNRNRLNSNSNYRFKSRPKKKKFTNKISDHFSKNDFACKESGKFRISLGLVGVLEELRGVTQKRINIIKGYECPEVAEAKGQLKRNFHTQGLAADIQILNMSPIDVFKEAEKLAGVVGIGLNLKEEYVHIDTRKAERLLWVEENNEEIPITDDNRKQYLSE
tara:strand:- start:250 stop:819 length:570 start_codon:yes stop_codon:yes gene_type:complete